MIDNKKGVNEFLEDVIIPIEQNHVDTGKYYVMIKGLYSWQEKKIKLIWGGKDNHNEDWPLPIEHNPGEWKTKALDDSENTDYFRKVRLATISGLLWSNAKLEGVLYLAEYEGLAEKLQRQDFVGIYPRNDEQKRFVNNLDHIYNCIPTGVKVEKARLIHEVNKWNPYMLWTFAIDCATRALNEYQRLGGERPPVYKEGIEFAHALSKHIYLEKSLEMEELLNTDLGANNFENLIVNRGNALKEAIEQNIAKHYGMDLVGRAVINSLSEYYSYKVANEARTQRALIFEREYRDKYEIPSMREKDLYDRITYAFMKSELDWQVAHLNKMLVE